MSELNFKPATLGGLAGDKSVAVPALDAGAAAGSSARSSTQARRQRRRFGSTRLQLDDSGFRPFRVY